MSPKAIAVFDIDKTIYDEHSFFGCAKYFVSKRIISQLVYNQAMTELVKYKAKTQTYQTTAKNILVVVSAAVAGKNYQEVKNMAREFFELERVKFYPYFEKILPKLKEKHEVWLVTNNAQFIAEAIQDIFELDGYISTIFEVKDGLFTGKITQSLADGKNICKDLVKNYSGKTIGVGDSVNDIGIFETVKYPLCINPSEELIKIAQERSWSVVTDENIEDKLLSIIS